MEKIKLRFPFTYEGVEVTEVEMRNPIVRDHIWIKSKFGSDDQRKKREVGTGYYDDDDRQIALLARLIERDIEFVYSLSLADMGKLSKVFKALSEDSTDSVQKIETN
ncbi:MAG: phage tail assembly protein [Vibrio sp.]